METPPARSVEEQLRTWLAAGAYQPALIHTPDDLASFLRYPLVRCLMRGG
jgi:hypothetical protein